MKMIVVLFFAMGLFMQSCDLQKNEVGSNVSETTVVALSDKEISNRVLFDSLFIENFFKQHIENSEWKTRVLIFYRNRNFVPAWYTAEGIDSAAKKFILLYEEDEALSNLKTAHPDLALKHLFHQVTDEHCKLNNCQQLKLALDVLLTISFFDYAEHNWKGVSEYKSMEIGWFIERKKLNYVALLESMTRRHSQESTNDEPVFRQYVRLKKKLLKYVALEKSGGLPKLNVKLSNLSKGDSSFFLRALKRELYLMGDLLGEDSTLIFDERLGAAICSFQIRHGLRGDSLLDKSTLKALRIPLRERIEQLLINMERCRWLPYEFKGDYLMVNIPDYKLSVFHQDSLAWSCRVVLGKQSTETVIFNDTVEYIVFSPYWNVPQSIIRKELIPSIVQNKNYLFEHNMEVLSKGEVLDPGGIKWTKYTRGNVPYEIRERPGIENSLGLVKFLFPNTHNIYLHDTPAKSLFDKSTRAFSHGCIRVQEPFKLAQHLLFGDSTWTPNRITELMNGGVEKYVRLKTKVPIFIVYFTAWVTKDGRLHFREDVYGHDAKMKGLLLL